MRRSSSVSVSCLSALCLTVLGCVNKGPSPTQKEIDPAYIETNLLAEQPPQIGNRIDADIGGKVIYLGNDLTKSAIAPGGTVNIVHYWKVVDPPGERWRVFAHLVGSRATDWANIDYTDMRHGYPPAKWQAGDIIRDEQTFAIPDNWASKNARIMVGLYPKGGHTAADRMEINSGPKDNESRVRVAQIAVQTSVTPKKKQTKPGYVIHKASGPITIDGRADEPDWKRAKPSPTFVTTEGGHTLVGDTRARLLWDHNHLYAFISAQDSDVFSQYHKHDDSLWKEDVIELFIDADRSRRGYIELQVNPNNTQFDAFFPTTRAQKSDVAWSANMNSQVNVRGTADNRDDEDQGWDVEIAIPLAAVKGTAKAMRVSLPPKPGDNWRLNIVRIDKPKNQQQISAGSWNQITNADFHALGRMLEVRFGDEQGNVEPPKNQPTRAPTKPGPMGTTPAHPAMPPGSHPPTLQPNQPSPSAAPAP